MATDRRAVRSAALVLVVLGLLVTGCGSIPHIHKFEGRGLLYTHRIKPLTRNHRPFEANGTSTAKGVQKQLHVQYVTITWDSNAIGEIAKRAGIKTILYADIERESILLGLWRRTTVHIYGYGE
jgi:hypothetical protein